MRAPVKASVGLAFAVALGSCSEAPKIQIFNNSGRDLVLRLGDEMFWDATRTRIPASSSKTVYWGRLAEKGMVILEVAGCVRAFDPPPIDRAYFQDVDTYNPSAKVQVDADFSVVLLPVTATAIMPEARDLPLQSRYGFPLRPVSVTCDPTKP